MSCANCEALREEVERLKRELGWANRKGEMGAIGEHLEITMQQARIVQRLYNARGNAVSAVTFVDEEIVKNEVTLRTQVGRIRDALNQDFILVAAPHGAGYKLSTPAMSMVLAAISPLELQPVRG